jgi:hypothetical protein
MSEEELADNELSGRRMLLCSLRNGSTKDNDVTEVPLLHLSTLSCISGSRAAIGRVYY